MPGMLAHLACIIHPLTTEEGERKIHYIHLASLAYEDGLVLMSGSFAARQWYNGRQRSGPVAHEETQRDALMQVLPASLINFYDCASIPDLLSCSFCCRRENSLWSCLAAANPFPAKLPSLSGTDPGSDQTGLTGPFDPGHFESLGSW